MFETQRLKNNLSELLMLRYQQFFHFYIDFNFKMNKQMIENTIITGWQLFNCTQKKRENN